MGKQVDNFQRLEDMLGYNPTKQAGPTATALEKAKAKLAEEDAAAAETKAEEILRKAIEISRKVRALEAQFNSEKAKANKELGKVLGQLPGQPAPEPDE